jgi:hypothetical protein
MLPMFFTLIVVNSTVIRLGRSTAIMLSGLNFDADPTQNHKYVYINKLAATGFIIFSLCCQSNIP